MKRMITGVVALLLCATASAAFAETLKYRFKEPGDAGDWRPTFTDWTIRDGAYGPAAPSEKPVYSVSVLVAKRLDRRTPFDRLIVRTTLAQFAEGPYAGILIRATREKRTLSGYLLLFQKASQTEADIAIFRLDRANLEKNTGDAEALCRGTVKIKKPSSLEIRATGAKLVARYNGETLCSHKDKTYDKGFIGLFGYSNNELRPGYRNVQIEAKD